MDDDDFNVVGTYGDDEPLTYPGSNEEEDEARTTLNEIDVRRGKRMREELENAPTDEFYVHPMDWHMRMPCSLEEREAKRAKMIAEEAAIERLSTRILEARRRRREEKGGEVREVVEEDNQRARANLILQDPPMDGSPWIGVSSDDGDIRLYVRLRRARRKEDRIANGIHERTRSIALTATPLEKLVQEANILRERRTVKDVEMIEESENNGEEERMEIGRGHDGLWVNKYAPTKFTELLSPDPINRQVMRWLRLWDECVFGKTRNGQLPLGEDEKENALFEMDDGKPKRPVHRILVLSGPAGQGKTTLAGVAARLAGYNVVELNASDSRNVPDLEKVVEGAVRSTKTLDHGQRPNCLILDEIDGAPVEAVRWLVKTIVVNGKKAIKRPIIAICNNLFTPSLHDLRAVAVNIPMAQTKSPRVVERLREICHLEEARVDLSALESLARLCAADIRLCLNVLQYVACAARCSERAVGVSEMETAVEKARPPSANVFAQWSLILEFSRHHDSKGMVQSVRERLRSIEAIAMHEDAERLAQGVHHNYTSINTLTSSTLSAASRVFSQLDSRLAVLGATKNYALARYLTPFFLQLHLIIASHAKAVLQYPTIVQNVSLRHKQSQETISTVRSRLKEAVSPSELVLDTLPFIVSILQPPIKTINSSLLSRQEQQVIRTVVEGLAQFGLTFTPVTQDGILQYIFSPPVDVLTMFPLSFSPHRKMVSNNVRKLLAHEVLLASVRHNPLSLQPAPVPPSHSTSSSIPSCPNPSSASSYHGSSAIPFVPLHYKYNNCYSNAVKRKVRITQLIM